MRCYHIYGHSLINFDKRRGSQFDKRLVLKACRFENFLREIFLHSSIILMTRLPNCLNYQIRTLFIELLTSNLKPSFKHILFYKIFIFILLSSVFYYLMRFTIQYQSLLPPPSAQPRSPSSPHPAEI